MEPARRDLRARVALGLLLPLCACAHDWTNADLQLDVTDFPFSDEERIAICVAGAGLVESAAGTGLLDFPGIPETFPRTVTVANEDGRGASVEFETAGFRTVAASELRIDDCPGTRSDQGDGLLLAVRLLP